MVNRPYFNSGIDELERIFAMLEEVESLETLRTELVQRSTPRSRTLLRRVDEAIERCKSESVKEKMDIRAPLLRPKIEPDSSPPSALSTSSPKFAPEEPETLTENHRRLIDLLTYLEHLAKIGEKPVFNLRDYQPTLVSEAELKGQVGITHDASTEEGPVWLKIERLQRTEPPLPPSELRDWIAVSRDPNQLP